MWPVWTTQQTYAASYLSSRQRIGEDRRAGRVQLGSATWQMTWRSSTWTSWTPQLLPRTALSGGSLQSTALRSRSGARYTYLMVLHHLFSIHLKFFPWQLNFCGVVCSITSLYRISSSIMTHVCCSSLWCAALKLLSNVTQLGRMYMIIDVKYWFLLCS